MSKYVFQGTGLSPEEKKWGQIRFDNYLDIFPHLSRTLANQQALEELVWNEAVQERLKRQAGPDAEDQAEPVPPSLQKSINDGLNMIFEMKERLGMLDQPMAMDAYELIQDIFNRGDDYRQQHIKDYITTCPSCKEEMVLKIETKDMEAFITPFFPDGEGSQIQNRPLYKLFKEGILTKKEVADIMGVSPAYIDWMKVKIYGEHKPKEDQPPPEG